MKQENPVKIADLQIERTLDAVERWLSEHPEVKAVDFTVNASYWNVKSAFELDFTEVIFRNTTLERIVISAACLGGDIKNLLLIIQNNTTLMYIKIVDKKFLDSKYEGNYSKYTVKPEVLHALQKNYTLMDLSFWEESKRQDLSDAHQLWNLFYRNRLFNENLSAKGDAKSLVFKYRGGRVTFSAASLEYFFYRLQQTGRTVLSLEAGSSTLEDVAAFDLVLKYIEQNPQLYSVDFSDCRIGDSNTGLNISKLCEVLTEHPGILDVNLTNTLCDDAGAKAIAELLKNKKVGLAFVNLSNNPTIQSDGMDEIAGAIAQANQLVELDLSGCPISSDKVQVFANPLRQNRSINKLKIGFKDTPSEILPQFLNAVRLSVKGSSNSKKKQKEEEIERQNPPFLFPLEIKELYWFSGDSSSPKGWKEIPPAKKKGNTINPVDKYNSTHKASKDKLIAAVVGGNKEEVEACLKYASIHVLNNEGESLLHTAVKKGHVEVAQLLLNRKINTKLRDKNFKTAADLARELNKMNLADQIEPPPKKDPVSNLLGSGPNMAPSTHVEAGNEDEKTESQSKKQLTPPTENPPASPSATKKAKVTQVAEQAEEFPENVQASPVFHHVVAALLPAANEDNNAHPPAFELLFIRLFDNLHNQQLHKEILLDIWKLIKEKPEEVTKRVVFKGEEFQSALECAVKIGHYKLMKIILHSPYADPDTVLPLACKIANLQIIKRLLIDVRIKAETIDALCLQPSLREEVRRVLENKKQHLAKVEGCGITWVKEFSLVYGSQHGKPLNIQSQSAHAELVLHNNFSRTRLIEPEFDADKETIKNYDGNPVTASLTFIISVPGMMYGEKSLRRSITFLLDFVDQHHVTSINEEERAKRIQHRIRSAPSACFNEANKVEDKVLEVENFYQAQKEGDPNFQQQFHHGEQALLDYLEHDETVSMIVNRLMEHPELSKGAKIIQVLLNIHSPRYVCENCEMGILGEQNAEQSHFLNKLSQKLVMAGYRIPQFSPIRMLTQVSAYLPCSGRQDSDAPKKIVLDLRGCNNQMILAKDLSKVKATATQFESNMKHF